VSNSLDNLSNLVTIPNNVLQGDFKIAGINTGRFLVNTTVGVLGLFDVAQHIGMPEYVKEDYGQSLARHGVGPGCYIVLPVLGPSTARDTVSLTANYFGGDAWYNVSVANDTQHFSDFDYYASKVAGGVDFRAKNYDAIENLEKNSMDFYSSVKSLYLQDRQQKILNSNKIIDTQDDSDWEEIQN
jgi:phospholipid-binding lipoprotein MlaA